MFVSKGLREAFYTILTGQIVAGLIVLILLAVGGK